MHSVQLKIVLQTLLYFRLYFHATLSLLPLSRVSHSFDFRFRLLSGALDRWRGWIAERRGERQEREMEEVWNKCVH